MDIGTFVPADLAVVATLVLLEGLLSCDNAVVLATLVRHLPEAQRGKALRYGILGAYVFRVLALCLATWVMSIWWLKVAGGAYLLWIGLKPFLAGGGEADEQHAAPRTWFGLNVFWSTVLAVECADMVFSVDSIAAAVALSDQLWVLIAGGFLGILAMRFAAQGFLVLLQRFPMLERAAFVAVALIGLKLLCEFPVDQVTTPVPLRATYHDAASYSQAAQESAPPLWQLGHQVQVRLHAPAAPERALFLGEHAEREYERARAEWLLHLRPLLEIEGLLASGLIALVFACGFLRRAPADTEMTEPLSEMSS